MTNSPEVKEPQTNKPVDNQGHYDRLVRNLVRNLTVKYLIALAMFAVLAIDGYLILQASLKTATYSVQRMNLSSKQQKLFHDSTILAEELVSTTSSKEKQRLKKELKNLIKNLEFTHNALIFGNKSISLPFSDSPKVNAIYFKKPIQLDKHIKNYLKAVQYLVTSSNSQITEENRGFEYIYKVKQSRGLVNALNVLTGEFVNEQGLAISRMQLGENMVFFTTLFIIFITGIYIFQPMVSKIHSALQQLEKLNQTLEQKVQERTLSLTKVNNSLQAEINERKKAEEEVKKAEQLFRSITENMSDLVAVIDLEGKRMYNNPAYEKLFGKGRVTTGSDSFQEIHPEDRPKIMNAFEQVISTGLPQRAEYRFILKDGATSLIESVGSSINNTEGKPEFVIVVARDITDRKVLQSI